MIAFRNEPKRYFLTLAEIRSQAADYPRVTSITGETFAVDQNGLLMHGGPYRIREKPTPEMVDVCLRWLQRAEAGRIKTPTLNSYTLKHAVERWSREYISNGSFLIAADQLGFRMVQDDRTWRATLNMDIGIGRRWYHQQPESLYWRNGAKA
ncbi:MAG: hypothetical protein KDB00_13900 [Planctomycetales bacterium]|nr:hypothetical protein [Planctomycetales bacterium]